ncbi:hypothetical protein [Sphingorhabdus sp.]|jgi:hypothetical protein|uniref:hypothetical protein n=1 Tax=Sphingorhabdus sp. TaxID=1902408 RepID=UPI0037C6C262
MMTIALLLVQTALPPSPLVAPAEDDIVVIGNKLKVWNGKGGVTFGIRRCRTTKSTGDKEIDNIGCRVMIDCLLPMKPRIIGAAKAAGRDAEKRKAAQAPLNAELTACVNARRAALINELLDRRAAKRSEAGS